MQQTGHHTTITSREIAISLEESLLYHNALCHDVLRAPLVHPIFLSIVDSCNNCTRLVFCHHLQHNGHLGREGSRSRWLFSRKSTVLVVEVRWSPPSKCSDFGDFLGTTKKSPQKLVLLPRTSRFCPLDVRDRKDFFRDSTK